VNRIDPDNILMRPPRRRERKALIELTGSHFEEPPGSGNWEKFCREGYLDGSCYDWDTSRIAVIDGRMVGHIGIWGHTRRIGRAKVTSGGLGTVMTHSDVRGAGIGRLLIEGVLQSMAEAGYDTSFMAGIPGFYAHFGWVPSWSRRRIEINVGSLPDDTPAPHMRRASLLRMIRAEGPIGRIYRREQAGVVGATVRPLFTKDHRHWRLVELLDPRRRVCGYIASTIRSAHEFTILTVHELGGVTTPAGQRRVLAALRQMATDNDCMRIHLPYGPEHPLAPALRLMRCSFIEDYNDTGGDLIRIINLPTTLRKMAAELTARIADSPMTGRSGAVTLALPEKEVTLVIRRGRVSVAPAPVPDAPRVGGNWHTARLLIGADAPGAIAEFGKLRYPSAARPWIKALFPKYRHESLRADTY